MSVIHKELTEMILCQWEEDAVEEDVEDGDGG